MHPIARAAPFFNSPRRILLAALGVALLAGFFVAQDYGLSWDEIGIYRYANRMLGAYAYLPRPAEFDSLDPDPLLNLYGPAHFMYVALLSRPLLTLHPLWKADAAAHFIYLATFLAGIYFLYLLALRWMSEKAALGMSLLLLTQPLLWGHALTNPKDTPFMAFFAASVYFGFSMMDNPTWKKIAVAGIVLGWTTAMRALGPMAGALALLYGLIQSPRRAWRAAPLYFLLAGGVTWLLWPYLWKAPFANFVDSLQIMSKFPNTGETLFMGKLYPADQLPPFYFPVFILLQFTEPFLLCAAAGVFSILSGWRKTDARSRELLLLLVFWFLLPALYVAFSGSTLYDNARQLLFLLPPLFLLAGEGLELFLSRIKALRWQAALLALLILPGVFFVIRLHPYQYVYFNSLTGGVGGAFRKFDLDYSGTSLKEAQEYLNLRAEPGAKIKILGPRPSARFYARPDLKIFSPHDDIDLRAGESYYFVYLTRANADLNRCDGETVYVIARGGGILAYVKKVAPGDKCW